MGWQERPPPRRIRLSAFHKNVKAKINNLAYYPRAQNLRLANWANLKIKRGIFSKISLQIRSSNCWQIIKIYNFKLSKRVSWDQNQINPQKNKMQIVATFMMALMNRYFKFCPTTCSTMTRSRKLTSRSRNKRVWQRLSITRSINWTAIHLWSNTWWSWTSRFMQQIQTRQDRSPMMGAHPTFIPLELSKSCMRVIRTIQRWSRLSSHHQINKSLETGTFAWDQRMMTKMITKVKFRD